MLETDSMPSLDMVRSALAQLPDMRKKLAEAATDDLEQQLLLLAKRCVIGNPADNFYPDFFSLGLSSVNAFPEQRQKEWNELCSKGMRRVQELREKEKEKHYKALCAGVLDSGAGEEQKKKAIRSFLDVLGRGVPLYPIESESCIDVTRAVEALAEQLPLLMEEDASLALLVADGLLEIIPALWPHLGRGDGKGSALVRCATFSKQFSALMQKMQEIEDNPPVAAAADPAGNAVHTLVQAWTKASDTLKKNGDVEAIKPVYGACLACLKATSALLDHYQECYTEIVSVELKDLTDALGDTSKGAPKGQSWKDGLEESSTWTDVCAKAQKVSSDEVLGKQLNGMFKKVLQACILLTRR